ncbi:isochorismate synthase [Haloplanus pelagicus]|uniref:isochorismate synthase n=1 Tax=Haloplanus pelagicus TaxID=2949995 RepID=UPI00204142AB|nr:isochorismate synthase [Haloplanus sp. HW8-1]
MGVPRSDETGTRLVSRSVRTSVPSLRAALDTLPAPRTFWTAPDEATVVAGGVAAAITADGHDRFGAIRTGIDRVLRSGDVHAGTEAACPRLFGGFAFHDEGGEGSVWDDFPGARFVLPRVQVTETNRGTWLTVNAVGPDATATAVEDRLDAERERLAALDDPDPATPPDIVARERTTPRAAWRDSVETAVERIRAGDLQKVVLAQALDVTLDRPLSVPDVLARLGSTYPDCYRFLVEPTADPDRPSFFGATPERLVSRHGRTVTTGALAGTTGRGDTPAEDDWLAAELLDDEKNVHEHELVAETIRKQLAPFASSIGTGERRVRRLETVQHLSTPITATLDQDTHVLDLVEALHPTPAVGGLPPERALATIRETEPFDRGWYAAPVGWVDAAGNGTFAVAIRSALARDTSATLFAGVGIVADSDPDREWDEVQLKYRPILDELER